MPRGAAHCLGGLPIASPATGLRPWLPLATGLSLPRPIRPLVMRLRGAATAWVSCAGRTRHTTKDRPTRAGHGFLVQGERGCGGPSCFSWKTQARTASATLSTYTCSAPTPRPPSVQRRLREHPHTLSGTQHLPTTLKLPPREGRQAGTGWSLLVPLPTSGAIPAPPHPRPPFARQASTALPPPARRHPLHRATRIPRG